MIRTLISHSHNQLFRKIPVPIGVGIRFINVDVEKEKKRNVNKYISESLVEGTKLSALSFGTGLGFYGSTMALSKLGLSAAVLGIAVPCTSLIVAGTIPFLLSDREHEDDVRNYALAMASGLAISPLLFTVPDLYPQLICSNIGLIGGALIASNSIRNNETSVSRWTYPVRVSALSGVTYFV